MSRRAAVMEERLRTAGGEATRRLRTLVAGLLLAGLSAALWGWATRSAVVAALTLVTAVVQVVAGRRASESLRERALAPLWTGMVWTAVDVLWVRFGIAGWGRF